MSRFFNPAPQFTDKSNNLVANGLLYFYEPGGSSVLKDTYSDSNLTTPNENPVQLDGAGRLPDVFLSGQYRIVLTTATGRVIWQRDPAGEIPDPFNWEEWDNLETYVAGDIVVGSNGLYYSAIAGSTGSDPTIQPSAFWQEIMFTRPFNLNSTYRQGELTIASDGRTYQSQVGSNTGNDPTVDSGANWQILIQQDDTPTFQGLVLEKTDVQNLDVFFENDGANRWAIAFDSSENLSIERYDAGGVLLDAPLVFNTSGDVDFNNPVNILDQLTTKDITIDRAGDAADAELIFSVDGTQDAVITFAEAGFENWKIRSEGAGNQFSIERWTGGSIVDTPLSILDADGTVVIDNNLSVGADIELESSEATILANNAAATDMNLDFVNTTGDLAMNVFKTTNSTGARTVDVYKGDGSATVTVQMNAADGSITPAANEVGAKKIRKITLDTAAPSGGSDGDIWLRYV